MARRPPLGTARIIRGNALALPLPDESVDLVVTSPPYFGLRSYQDGGEHYDGQIGAEPTPAQFVDALIRATAEMTRVLKPSGSIWVNLGDKYAMDDKWGGRSGPKNHASNHHVKRQTGIRSKSLIGVPWRYALRCIDDLGLILRAEIIWAKPNGLPESVTDRVRRSHETWFHFTKEPRYYSAVDEIREAQTSAEHHAKYPQHERYADTRRTPAHMTGAINGGLNPLGKLPGSVWTIPTQPLRVPEHLGVDHFAAFPLEWPRRIIRGWSPAGVCTECGEGRRPVAERASMERHNGGRYTYERYSPDNKHGTGATTLGYVPDYRITGYACACTDATGTGMACGMPFANPTHASHEYGNRQWCPGAYGTAPPTTPATILDPFGGTGTTALVAKALGRTGISVDMSADYCRLAQWRTTDPRELAAALEVDPPTPAHADQLDLLDGLLEPATTRPDRPRGGIAYANARGRTCGACGYRSQSATSPQCEKCGGPIERTA